MNKEITHGSLFTGIGAFDLAAEANGLKNIWNCEILDFPRLLLKKRFPDAKQYNDVRTMCMPPKVDIISGGFPCQNISIVGRAEGIDGIKSGLWREMLRICGEVRPRYIIIENTAAILTRGLETILEAFARIGYDAQWQCLQGYQFGTPQRRRRLYAIFYATCFGDGIPEKQIFAGWNQFEHPTWRDTNNRIYGVANDVPHRVDRHAALGNAVQPVIADYLFKCILNAMKYEYRSE